MADKTQKLNGVDVLIKDGTGTVFGGPTLNDRIRDANGILTKDVVPLTYEGLVTLPVGSDTLTAVDEIDVTTVTLNKKTASVVVGAKTSFTTTVKPDNATDKTVTWSSSAPAIATVSKTGEVTGVAAGKATITAKAGLISATAEVTVTAE